MESIYFNQTGYSLTLIFYSIHLELGGFCDKNNHCRPNFGWTLTNGVRVLQQYPAGVSRCVLLTELEHRWRTLVRRGENAGRLKQVLSIGQVSATDVLIGKLTSCNVPFRFRLDADGASVDLLMHQQMNGWIQFSQSHCFEPFDDRTVCLTNCQLLHNQNGQPPMILPTTHICFILDFSRPKDALFLNNTLMPLYYPFLRDVIAGNVEALTKNVNIAIHLVFASVLEIGSPMQHPINLGNYRVVKMALSSTHSSAFESRASSSGTAHSDQDRIIFLILLDEQTSLSNLWEQGDALFIYRPWISPNETEILFGRRTEVRGAAHGAFDHDIVHRADDMLKCALESSSVAPVHLLISSATVCAKVRGGGSYSHSTSSVAPLGDTLYQSGPIDFSKVTLTSFPHFPVSLFARFVVRSGLTGNENENEFSFLWMRPEIHTENSPSRAMQSDSYSAAGRMLIRVKYPNSALHTAISKNQLQVGQLFLLTNLLIEAQDESSSSSNERQPCPTQDLPAWVATSRQLHAVLGSASPTSTTLFDPSDHILNVSRLASLVCSPSILRPVDLAMQESVWAENGCVLVRARVTKLSKSNNPGFYILSLCDCVLGNSLDAEIDEHCSNLTQYFPSIGSNIDTVAISSAPFATRWLGNVYYCLLSRIDDLIGVNDPKRSPEKMYRVNTIADCRSDGDEESPLKRTKL